MYNTKRQLLKDSVSSTGKDFTPVVADCYIYSRRESNVFGGARL